MAEPLAKYITGKRNRLTLKITGLSNKDGEVDNSGKVIEGEQAGKQVGE